MTKQRCDMDHNYIIMDNYYIIHKCVLFDSRLIRMIYHYWLSIDGQ